MRDNERERKSKNEKKRERDISVRGVRWWWPEPGKLNVINDLSGFFKYLDDTSIEWREEHIKGNSRFLT